ncbi:Immunity protein 49 [Nocardia amikacinitolerans]|uniref:immunity 49 family protein n=1 Tax=Nocardia amikacinitolerans TaxID=756689 RepID=UPI0020A2DB88|nr:immunity 49 family protein [Nocardia amikacinitolerans]MCP2295942.1 Immunity protein 49 [Nocardia amikacinitolerans]
MGLRRNLTKAVERLPRSFDRAFNTATTNISAQLMVDPQASKIETWESMVAAMQISSAMFAAATAPAETTVNCMIDHKEYTFPAIGPTYYTNAGNWISAFWYAIVCRDQTRMTALAAVPLDLLRASGAAHDDYLYDWVDTLQTYWTEQPGIVEKLTATLDKSSPDIATIADRETLNKILYPPINLFYRFLRRDHSGFNEALEEALHLHQQYWTSPDREIYLSGNLALGPLAISCLAYDAGFPIEVESDYIPIGFLDRGWLGEFPT